MIRTMIVDDELLSGVGVQSLIHGKEGIHVAGVFNSAMEAIDFLKENMVDIVITDIEMGDISGLELIQIIREQHLAEGVIILSCHDDFSYAQEAISKGTDGYLLKHSVTEDILIDEIKKVYQKYQGHRPAVDSREDRTVLKQAAKTGRETYTIGVLRLDDREQTQLDTSERMEKTMLVHLLEGIVAHYRMGTLYAPYDREIFIIFQQNQDVSPPDRQEALLANLAAISRILKQYINSRVSFGLSTEFTGSEQIHSKYDEAFTAAEMCFYQPEQTIFSYRKLSAEFIPVGFSTEHFQEEDGAEVFRGELREYLYRASFYQLAVQDLRAQLIQAVGKIVYQVLHEYRFSPKLVNKWDSDAALVTAITSAKNVQILEKQLNDVFEQFRQECLTELEEDGLSRVLEYIEKNLNQKLQLADLASISYMSVPSFSKKFKERTGLTLVQYLNESRIRQAKVLLKNPHYSLEDVASATGFSNANYLVRVFKKVTGMTIGEYRK